MTAHFAEFWDRELFGWRLHEARKKAGYDTAISLRNAVKEATGLTISSATIHNLEYGESVPSIQQLLALNWVIFGNPYSMSLIGCAATAPWLVNYNDRLVLKEVDK